jgi:hypothetical protein
MANWMTTLWHGLVNGAEKADAKPGLDLERRQMPRYHWHQSLSCRPAALGDTSWVEVCLHDVSAGGLSLSSPCAFEPDSLIEVERLALPGKRPLRLVSCVRHVSQEQPGRWRLGCSFIRELDDLELAAFQQAASE